MALACVGGCAAGSAGEATPAAPPGTGGGSEAVTRAALPIHVPEDVPAELREVRPLATGLRNPRGILPLEDGSILIAEAGTGDPEDPTTGRLLRLVDEDGDGTFQAPDEWKVLVDGQRSVNILQHLDVHRDEVFGFADIARGDGMILASVAHPLEGSYILRVDEEPAVVWGTTKDNANSLAFHPARGRWYAVQSFANTVVEILDGRVTRTVAAIPDLPEGQQSVPSALEVDPITGELLVVLFSGQRGGDTAGSGVDFVERSGQVVRVHPGSGAITTVATGINAPVDLAVAPDGTLYVLSFCERFLDPVDADADLEEGAGHGGFERHTGSVVRISRGTGEATVLARELDLPTHVHLRDDGSLLVADGQGTPGRAIPSESGTQPLQGRLLELRARP
jgi:hypothetical protein